MELNAEQIKKALECWGSGIPCHEKCSILEHEGSGNCLRLTTINAIALIKTQEQRIKELSEEAESWRIDAENYRNERDELRRENNVLPDQIDQLAKDLEEIIDYAIEAKKRSDATQ